MKLIGIIGKMGTGESTLARILAERLGGKVYSFADALREEVSAEYGIPLDDLRAKPTPPHMVTPATDAPFLACIPNGAHWTTRGAFARFI